MKVSAFSCAFSSETNHVVCTGTDGSVKHWYELVQRAGRIALRLDSSPGSYWALDIDDTYEFACALVGCWAAGKVAVLASSQLLGDDDPDLAVDGILCTGSGLHRGCLTVALDELPSEGRHIDTTISRAGIVLYTSGSTGRPKRVTRELGNVGAELEAFESLWGETLGTGRVYSTVSCRHVYGLLFGVLWPLLYKRPFARAPLQYPEQLLGGIGAANALVTSPALLKRIGHLPEGSGRWRLVFSSGGVLPLEAATTAERVLGTCPIEVLGSTETSGVAWRRQRGGGPHRWTPLPDVLTRIDHDGLLEVSSPYSGASGWLRMDDRARLDDDGGFELFGRGDRIAKIEDKRVSLAEIEHKLQESAFVNEAAVIALADEARQFTAAVIQLSSEGDKHLSNVGRRALGDQLRAALRGSVDTVALPRKIRFVGEIPVDAQGKRTQAELANLFAEL